MNFYFIIGYPYRYTLNKWKQGKWNNDEWYFGNITFDAHFNINNKLLNQNVHKKRTQCTDSNDGIEDNNNNKQIAVENKKIEAIWKWKKVKWKCKSSSPLSAICIGFWCIVAAMKCSYFIIKIKCDCSEYTAIALVVSASMMPSNSRFAQFMLWKYVPVKCNVYF